MAIRGIVFDLDGTLVDTIEDLAVSLGYALTNNGLQSITVDGTRKIVGNGIKWLCSQAVGDENAELADAVLAEMKAHYSVNYKNKTQPYQGITELLEELAARDIFISVLTNKVENIAVDVVRHYFGDWDFNPVFGAVEHRALKPAPEALHKVLELQGLSANEALFVGDSEVDIITAKNAGVKSVAVSWGFRSRSQLQGNNPDFMVDNPLEILELLDK